MVLCSALQIRREIDIISNKANLNLPYSVHDGQNIYVGIYNIYVVYYTTCRIDNIFSHIILLGCHCSMIAQSRFDSLISRLTI